MNRSFVIVSLITLLASCKGSTETSTSTVTTSTTATQASATTAAPAPAPTGTSLASQQTNWPGITAEVTEFRRKGNTVTAKVRLVNTGAEKIDPEIFWQEVSLIDTTGGKKYEVLKDEKGAYLAANRQSYTDRWAERIEPNQSQIIWMKFPAPPREVKTITLQLPKMPPFDDLTIQD